MTAPSVPGRRDRKKRETRAALSAAALRLVAERGLDGVTVEDIAEACDLSARTFFNYFTSKDEAVVSGDDELDRVLDLFRAMPEGTSVFDALRMAFVPAIFGIEADRESLGLRMRVVADNPQLLPRLFAVSAAAERRIARAIAERVGVAPDHTYPAVAAAVTGAAFRVALLRWAKECGTRPRPATLAALVDEAFDVVARGLVEPAAPAPATSSHTSS